MSKRTYAILGASPFTGNKGVNALLSGTLESLSKSGDEAIIVDYSIGNRNPSEYFERYGCLVNFVPLRFTWKIAVPNNVFLLLIRALIYRFTMPLNSRQTAIRNDLWLSQLRSVDFAAAISGGDSFSDIYGMRRLLYICLPKLLMMALGKPLVYLPQTIGPFKSASARILASFILKRALWVFARDDESVHAAKNLIKGDLPTVKLSRDMAFCLKSRTPENNSFGTTEFLQSDYPLVGVNVSGLLMMGGYSGNNMFGIACDYPKLINELIRWLINEKRSRVVLISHVTMGAERDQIAAKKIHEEFSKSEQERLLLLESSLNESEIKYVIGKCEILYGSRMHACIAALSQGIPAVGLAYSRKFRGLYKTLDAENLVLDLSKAPTETLLCDCQKLYQQRTNLMRTLKPNAELAREQALNLFSSLKATNTIRHSTTHPIVSKKFRMNTVN